MVRKLVLSLIAILGMIAFAAAQNKQISGTVTDVNGAPIAGATVVVEGTHTGTTTGTDGQFTVSARANGMLAVSFIGYETQKIAINGRTKVDVSLKEDTQSIEDVIVTAFGTAKKEAFTGSATVIKSDDISKIQSTSVTRALEGMVAGVQMTTSSGDLSSKPSIRIRGVSSITAGKEPLYIVDGVPYSGDMNNINTNDIEKMTVLKDAASNALYGARGANGVIMITTKRAKSQNAIITVDAKWGVNSRALQTYDYITSPAQYYETHYGALYNYYLDKSQLSETAARQLANQNVAGSVKNGGLGYQVYTVPEGEAFIGTNGKVNPNATLGRVVNYKGTDYLVKPDNWLDETYRSSLRQEYNASVSGTTDRSSVYASFGYLNNKGIISGSDMYRYTARLKADFQAKKWLKVGANVGYTNFNWNNGNSNDGDAGSTGNVFAFSSSIAPIYPVYIRDAQGKIMIDKNGMQMYDYGDGGNGGFSRPVSANSNALQTIKLDKDNSEGNAFNGTGFAEVSFLKDFKFTFNAGAGLDETRSTSTNNIYYGQFAPTGGTIRKEHTRYFYMNLQQLLSYSKDFAEFHHIDAMVGHEYYRTKSYVLGASKSKLFSGNTNELNGAVIDSKSASSYMNDYNNEGYFGRLQYDFKSKLFLSASYRRDASSRFHPSNRWGNFWSVGAGWLMEKESWFNVPWIDMLKIKASIGSQGNDEIGSYRYTDLYSIDNNEGEVAITFSDKGNPDITWETNTNFNTGVEFSFWQGRLSGSAEYFYRQTANMLFFFSVPSSLGYSGYYDNIGDMRNSGFELDLQAQLLRTKNVQWDFNLNMTHYKNKITMLPKERKTRKIEGYEGYVSGNKFYAEDLPLYTFLIPKYAGIDHSNGKPLWYKDVLDADGNVTGRETTDVYADATDYICGDPTPKLYGGFGTNVSFYGVDISANFTYSIGGLTYDSGYAASVDSPGGTPGSNWHKDVLKAWTPENTESNFPRLQYLDTNFASASDRFLVDASYLNIQNIQVGYTLPSKITKKFGVDRLRVYLACDNIYYWSYRKGLDPRYSFTGATSYASYSPIRTISGGINLTF